MHFDVQAVPAEQFAAWVDATRGKRARRSMPRATPSSAKQSMDVAPFTYRAADPGLFQQIVTQKLPPGPGPQAGRPDRDRISADGALACSAS